jgi:hypothetical protein
MSARRFKRFKNGAEKLTQMVANRPPGAIRGAQPGADPAPGAPADARNPGDSSRFGGIDAT